MHEAARSIRQSRRIFAPLHLRVKYTAICHWHTESLYFRPSVAFTEEPNDGIWLEPRLLRTLRKPLRALRLNSYRVQVQIFDLPLCKVLLPGESVPKDHQCFSASVANTGDTYCRY